MNTGAITVTLSGGRRVTREMYCRTSLDRGTNTHYLDDYGPTVSYREVPLTGDDGLGLNDDERREAEQLILDAICRGDLDE